MSTWGGKPPYGETVQLGQYRYGGQDQVAQVYPTQRHRANKGLSWPAVFAAFIVFAGIVGGSVYLFGFGGLDQINAAFGAGPAPPTVPTAFPTRSPLPPTFKPTPLPTNLRAPTSPYVVVTFTSPPTTPTAAVNAFNAASARWSTILAGTIVDSATINPGDTFNDFGCGLTNNAAIPNTNIDQLHIAADIAPIDGVGSVLGRAGPCNGFLESLDKPGTFLPVLGQMTFDNADLANLITAGTLEDVILHEMGHVLGLGTLWTGGSSIGIPDLVINEVFPFGQPIEPFNSPEYIGHGARAEYQVLSGTTDDIPVEDGSFQGLTPGQLASGVGQGSVDGHWRETVFQTELMTPAIGGTNNPMSLMTLRSLEDIGYGVDTSEADSYSIPSNAQSNTRISQREQSVFLHGDIFRCPTLEKGLEKAKNRARMRRRLGGSAGRSLHDG